MAALFKEESCLDQPIQTRFLVLKLTTIKMPTSYTFNGLLEDALLQVLKQCLNKSVNNISLEKASMDLHYPNRIECVGTCRVSVIDVERNFLHLDMASEFVSDIPFIVEQGRVNINIQEEKFMKLRDKMKQSPLNDSNPFHFTFRYTSSPIKSIRFYGNHQIGKANQFDPALTVEHLTELYNLEEIPEIDCNSIEFMVIEHYDQMKLRITIDDGMFILTVFENASEDSLREGSYIKINGAEKNIILQHEIK